MTDGLLKLKLIEHYEAQLNKLRKDNDSMLLDAIETSHKRGRIKQIKEFLSFLNDKNS